MKVTVKIYYKSKINPNGGLFKEITVGDFPEGVNIWDVESAIRQVLSKLGRIE